MTRKISPDRSGAPGGKDSFRKRYAAAERQRQALLDRLHALDASGRAHPSFRKSLTLLNQTFRRSRLVQRAAILQTAAWLIDLIEISTPFL